MKRLSTYLLGLLIIVALTFFFRGGLMSVLNPPAAGNDDPGSQQVAAAPVSDNQAAWSPDRNSGTTPNSPAPTAPEYTGTIIPILMYHEVTSGPNSLFVPVERFREQMRYLAASGYHTVTMVEAEQMLRDKRIPAKTVVLTFDDGYTSFIAQAWPILQEYGFTGTLYVCTSLLGQPNYLTMEEIKTLQTAGVEIGSHTCRHIDLQTASYTQQVEEIMVSKQILEEHLGVPCRSFCYPTGTYSDITPVIVKDSGYTSAVTVAYGHASPAHNPYLTPRVRVPGWFTLDRFAQNIPK